MTITDRNKVTMEGIYNPTDEYMLAARGKHLINELVSRLGTNHTFVKYLLELEQIIVELHKSYEELWKVLDEKTGPEPDREQQTPSR